MSEDYHNTQTPKSQSLYKGITNKGVFNVRIKSYMYKAYLIIYMLLKSNQITATQVKQMKQQHTQPAEININHITRISINKNTHERKEKR
jgi:hypothetical protein